MIVHKAVGVADPVVALVDKGEDSEKGLAILVVFEYIFFVVAAIGV